MKTVGVVAALAAEARAMGRARAAGAESAAFGNLAFLSDGSLLAVSGIGAAAAELAARALIDAGVAALMTFGMAGGLDPGLEPGSVLLPAEIISRDGQRIATCAAWRERLTATLRTQRAVANGALLTSPHAIDSPAGKSAAFRSTGAAAVDMESAAVALVAAEYRLPFISVRVIVDTAADFLPRSVVGASRAGQWRMGRLLTGLLRSPGEINALLRLAGRYRRAMQTLKSVARAGSLAPLDTEASAV